MRHSTTEESRTNRTGLLAGASLIALVAPALLATPATAFDFTVGNVEGSFDTTFTYGMSFRVSDRDRDLVGINNGGNRFSINGDDGNLNYDTGLVSHSVRGTHELLLDYDGFGIFTRATYFYDFENANGDNTEFKDLPDDSVQRVGKDFNLLDAYVFGGFDVGDVPVDFRLGDQVISWGESTFIQNGINTINPIDVNAIRIPGSEVRDALIPVTLANVNVDLTDSFSVEGFYQLDWEETEIDASGTYFSTNDFASPGGSILYLGFGNTPFGENPAVALSNNAAVPRGQSGEPSDSGQFGVAARYYAEELGNTELGFYYMNYHSRLPIVSARLASAPSANFFPDSEYFTDYPEDIQLLGASFNTQLSSGISLQGEVSYRVDQPLQVDDVEILQATGAIAQVTGTCATQPQAVCDATIAGVNATGFQVLQDLGIDTQGEFFGQLGQELSGFREFDVVQAQVTATQIFDPIPSVGIDQWALVGEIGATSVIDFPSKGTLRFDGPNTPLPGGVAETDGFGNPVPLQDGGFADEFSWGYRIRARADFLNAIGPINLFPVIGFAHDVYGTTPLPLGNFIEDRASVSIGLNATYLQQWSAGIQYTNFFAIGDDEFNLLRDRDFVSFNIKYSF